MKSLLFTLLFIPILSFGQEDVSNELTKKEKKSIDVYAIEVCDCMNSIMSELHPNTFDVVLLMAKEGEEAATEKIKEIIGALDSDEQQVLLASLEKVNTPEFLESLDECDQNYGLNEELKDKIDEMEGEAYDYLIDIFNDSENCTLVKSLIEISDLSEE